MKKLNKKHVMFSLSAVMVTGAGMMFYPSSGEANDSNNNGNIHLQVDKLDKDTLELSLTNIQDLPKSLQFTLQLGEGDVTFAEEGMTWSSSLQQSSSIQTHVTFDPEKKEAEFIIVSTEALPQEGGVLDLGQIDIVSKDNKAVKYTLTNKQSEEGIGYKYVVASTNQLVTESAFSVEGEGSLTYNTPPTLTLATLDIIRDGKVLWPQGAELTEDKKKSFVIAADDEDQTITDIKVEGNVKTDTVGSYTLTYTATDSLGDQVTLTLPIVVEATLKAPVITGVAEEKVIRLGETFDVLAGISATDTYGNKLDVKATGYEEVFDENQMATKLGTYTVTYTVEDNYNQTSEATMKLVIEEPNPTWENTQEILEVQVGEKVELLAAIKAKDYQGNDLTNRIEMLGDYTVGISDQGYAVKPGEYTVEYRVTDDYDNQIRHKMKLIVSGELTKPVISGVEPTLVVYVGEEVDVLSGISAVDHFGTSIKVTASGDYIDALAGNTAINLGEYNIYYAATDKYGNTTSAVTTLIVEKNSSTEEEYFIPEAIESFINKDFFKPTTGNATEGTPLYLEVQSHTTVEAVKQLIESFESKYEVVVTKSNSRALNEYVVTLINKEDELSKFYLTLGIGTQNEDVMNYLEGLIENESETPDDGETNKPEQGLPQIPENIEAVIDQDLFKPTKGNGSEENPLLLEVKEQTTVVDVKELVESFKEKYVVNVTKVTTSNYLESFVTNVKQVFKFLQGNADSFVASQIVEYLMTLTDETETLYLSFQVDSSNEEITNYLDELSEQTPESDGSNNGGNTGSGDNESTGNSGSNNGGNTGSGDNESTGNSSSNNGGNTGSGDNESTGNSGSNNEGNTGSGDNESTGNSGSNNGGNTGSGDNESTGNSGSNNGGNTGSGDNESTGNSGSNNGGNTGSGDNESTGNSGSNNGGNTGSGDNESTGNSGSNNGGNTGSGDNESTGNSGSNNGGNTGSGDNESTGNSSSNDEENTGIVDNELIDNDGFNDEGNVETTDNDNLITNQEPSKDNDSSAQNQSRGIQSAVSLAIAGVIAIGSGIGVAVKKRRK
ncbi:immunoglobulin-like domain-containing protein [Turicibacter sanguinis]|uniref:immunoglobulin-like domain-containing protein n=2 Tax=Turicibacter sanguinis TaxID=154288 RepID=UPI002330FC8D|nr:immunoglobulin-like domain-containing protein [Turicibacter sanguinis]MDB8553734.1 DUF5011 domain-containing protein [Turicibacter sanguinis]